MKTLNAEILKKNLQQFRFAAVRFSNWDVIGINCGLIKFNKFQTEKTNVISYREIGFQEYISIKKPFVRQTKHEEK